MKTKSIFKWLTIAQIFFVALQCATAQTTMTYDNVRARQQLTLGARTATAYSYTIDALSTNAQLPTALAVYNYVRTLNIEANIPGGDNAIGLNLDNAPGAGVVITGIDGVFFETLTGNSVEAGIRDTAVLAGKLARSGATTGQVLQWSGTAWVPSFGTPYTYVVASSTITTAFNTVLIPTLSTNITLGLPTCDAVNDKKQFLFQKSGGDTDYSMTIDPSGTQVFADGSFTKVIFFQSEFQCTCRFSSGTGVWFYNF